MDVRTTARRPVPVIFNPGAGQKVRLSADGELTAESLGGLLESVGMRADVMLAESGGEAGRLAQAALADGHRLLIAAGGDGTIGAVADEMLQTDATLGILPLGSVMNIPRSLDIPRDIQAAAAVLAGGEVRRIDVGMANGRPFYEAASVGMSTALFRAAERAEAGDYPSVWRSLWLALRYRPARMQLTLDDQQVNVRSLMVTVSNGPYTGIGLAVAPDARLDDGRFDVRVFSHFSKFELLRHLASICFGRRRYAPQVATYRAARVRIDSRRPLACRVDGRELGPTPVECEVMPAALRVIAGEPEPPASEVTT